MPPIARRIRWSTSACVSPAVFNWPLVTASEWSPPSTTCSSLGAPISRRTCSSNSSGQSASRVPWTKENRRRDLAQHLVAQLRRVAATAERITQANERLDFLLERNMATDARAHAFADEHYGTVCVARARFCSAARCARRASAADPVASGPRACRDSRTSGRLRAFPAARSNAASKGATRALPRRARKGRAA